MDKTIPERHPRTNQDIVTIHAGQNIKRQGCRREGKRRIQQDMILEKDREMNGTLTKKHLPPPPPVALRMGNGAMKNFASNLALLLGACLVGLVLCELSLRFFHPKYEGVVEVEYDMDEFRIWKRRPNERGTARHPDTGLLHPLNHNNLALRQDRNFNEQDIRSAMNIGFFGDSFTENIRIAAPYSFTEPLDYLLNLDRKNETNVFNLGVDGYGPGQSFLHYKHFSYVDHLDHVFYVFCKNDLKNIYQTNLFQLDDEGKVVQNVPSPLSIWTTFISRFHVSYLLFDVAQRLSIMAFGDSLYWHEEVREMTEQYKVKFNDPIAGGILQDYEDGNINNANIRNSIAIFKHLIFRWKELVEDNGGKFHIVLLPRPFSKNILSILEDGDDFSIVRLYDCFAERDGGPDPFNWNGSLYHFKGEGHWNEAGNRLAAICLYRYIERETGLRILSENDLQEELERYYSAFEQLGEVERYGQNPIRAKYSALTLLQEEDR